ncbi:MAG: glycine C-acetyltransferase, partial [candidate division WS1 bacterium]|nr:glycine C-acetyltransferase [candidate division WS1 bacterium]
MHDSVRDIFTQELDTIRQMGTYKEERVLQGPQAPTIRVGDREVLNFCANNYLGLSSHPQVMEAARHGLEQWGYGLSSVRFICGTQQLHKQLEQKLTEFLGTEDTILYSSCFDANIGLFSALLGPEDTVISDKLNHASIIDGIRLCKARREIYANSDMDQLESLLRGCSDCRIKLIATDGVFSVDGYIARLDAICDLADRYDALVMVDDSHATGFIGSTGRGTAEHYQVMERVDIITSTLGKALGGASGGFTSGRAEIVELLRQRSRPYLFSNSVTPSIAAAAMAALELVSNSSELRDTLRQ